MSERPCLWGSAVRGAVAPVSKVSENWNRGVPIALVLLGLSALGFKAHASSFATHTGSQQADLANLIVEGTVRNIRVEVSKNDSPITCYELDIEREFKGHVKSGVMLTCLPGGKLPDGRSSYYAGIPTFALGDHLIVHGVVRGPDRVSLVNVAAGVLHRVLDDYGTPMAADARGRPLLDMPAKTPPIVIRGSDARGSTRESFTPLEVPHPNPLSVAMTWNEARVAVRNNVRQRNTLGATIPGYAGTEQ
ncbi:MAG: hypothetical protein AAGA48_23810 [Myxococcota bacterium]